MSNNYQSDLAIPPGDFLDEVLDKLGITKVELSKITSIDEKEIDEIISAKIRISESIAMELENVTKVPTHIWLGLENEYQEILVTI